METKNIKLRISPNQHQKYFNMLIELRHKIGWDHEFDDNEVFIAPFILTCAAGLECTLNDKIIGFFTSHERDSDDLSKGFLSMNLRGKLSNIVAILTDGKYTINRQHKTYQALTELIGIRNRLVHNSSEYEECEAVVVTSDTGKTHFEIPPEVTDNMEDYTFGVAKPIGRFHDALEDIYEKFFEQYENDSFSENELIILNMKSKL